MRVGCVLALAALAAFASGAAAQDEQQRRLAAELVVMAGDARLVEAKAVTPLRLEGLRARLAGALSSLPLLLRRAGGDPATVPALRHALATRDWRALREGLRALQDRHPFAVGALRAEPTPERRSLGAAIHREACAGCHGAPAPDARLPALDLYALARELPADEFAARLLLGVRGDRSTAYRNPFSDFELAALIAAYEQGAPDAAVARGTVATPEAAPDAVVVPGTAVAPGTPATPGTPASAGARAQGR